MRSTRLVSLTVAAVFAATLLAPTTAMAAEVGPQHPDASASSAPMETPAALPVEQHPAPTEPIPTEMTPGESVAPEDGEGAEAQPEPEESSEEPILDEPVTDEDPAPSAEPAADAIVAEPVAAAAAPLAAWDVPNGTTNDHGAVVLNDGHIDVATLLEGETLTTQVKDGTGPTTVWRDLDTTVLQVLPGAEMTVPPIPAFSFLGAPGDPFWQLSQTQEFGLLWPGWSTESLPISATQGGVDWRLTDMTGPGHFAIYEVSSFGVPNIRFNTRDGVTDADTITIPKNTHAHGSWSFSAEGTYCLAFERSATLTSGKEVSTEFALAMAVGETDVMSVDPAACFAVPDTEPVEKDTTPIPDAALTSEARGPVSIVGANSAVLRGQQVSVSLGEEHSDEWVSVWLHSAPTWLGWQRTDAAGTLQVRVPSNAGVGEHRVAVKSVDGELIGWSALTVKAPAPVPAPAPAPPAAAPVPPAQTIAASQCVAGATILSSGHIDYGTRIVNGKLESLIKDGTTQTVAWREPSSTVLWLKPSSRVTLPGGFGQVGPAGSTIWQVPQTENRDLVWLGWNTESLNSDNARGAVSFTLNSVSGPGTVKTYLSSSFGAVQSMVFNNGGTYQVPLGVHSHANWAFSAEGIYRLNFTQSVTLANGRTSSDTETLTIAVGNVDPASAVAGGEGCAAISTASLNANDADAAAAAEAAEQAAAEEAAGAVKRVRASQVDENDLTTTSAAPAEETQDIVPMLLLVLGGLLVVGAAGGGVLWWRGRNAPAAGA